MMIILYNHSKKLFCLLQFPRIKPDFLQGQTLNRSALVCAVKMLNLSTRSFYFNMNKWLALIKMIILKQV